MPLLTSVGNKDTELPIYLVINELPKKYNEKKKHCIVHLFNWVTQRKQVQLVSCRTSKSNTLNIYKQSVIFCDPIGMLSKIECKNTLSPRQSRKETIIIIIHSILEIRQSSVNCKLRSIMDKGSEMTL